MELIAHEDTVDHRDLTVSSSASCISVYLLNSCTLRSVAELLKCFLETTISAKGPLLFI